LKADKVLTGPDWLLVAHHEGLENLLHEKGDGVEPRQIHHTWAKWEDVSVTVDWLWDQLENFTMRSAPDYGKPLAYVNVVVRNVGGTLDDRPITFKVVGAPSEPGDINWVLALRPWDRTEQVPFVVS
jgi:hypothetical protein